MLLIRGTGGGKDYKHWARVMSEWSWWRTKRHQCTHDMVKGCGTTYTY